MTSSFEIRLDKMSAERRRLLADLAARADATPRPGEPGAPDTWRLERWRVDSLPGEGIEISGHAGGTAFAAVPVLIFRQPDGRWAALADGTWLLIDPGQHWWIGDREVAERRLEDLRPWCDALRASFLSGDPA